MLNNTGLAFLAFGLNLVDSGGQWGQWSWRRAAPKEAPIGAIKINAVSCSSTQTAHKP